jgi:hypothetical protein
LLLKSDKAPSFVQYIDESKTDWYFTVVSRDGEIGLITAHDLKTGELIELGSRLSKCIFVRPEEYADLIEELEAIRDNGDPTDTDTYEHLTRPEQQIWDKAWETALDLAVRLVASRANPQPGVVE